jgi:hypothetical protein
MKLVRNQFRADGVFSRLYNDNGVPQCYTLEHSYANLDGTFSAKIPTGQWVCVRGIHQLQGMLKPFETFEITGVPGHTNLLFHMGNFDGNSEGCILVGDSIVTQGDGVQMVTNSVHTFEDFMNSLSGVTEFMLTVEG